MQQHRVLHTMSHSPESLNENSPFRNQKILMSVSLVIGARANLTSCFLPSFVYYVVRFFTLQELSGGVEFLLIGANCHVCY